MKEYDDLPEEEKKKIIEKKNAAKQAIIDRIYIQAKIIDLEDGTYQVKYKVPEECKCEIEINFVDDGKDMPIRGNKFVSGFVPKGANKTTN